MKLSDDSETLEGIISFKLVNEPFIQLGPWDVQCHHLMFLYMYSLNDDYLVVIIFDTLF